MDTIARLIDHTLLNPDASEQDIVQLCREAEDYGFYSVCVHPSFIKIAADALSRTNVKITAVIGFPLGMTFSQVKIYEAMEAALSGAEELDVVINIGSAKSDKWESVQREISDIITATPHRVHKIIIETCYLTDDEKIRACRAVMNAGAEFIKTSTGFGPAGAALKDVELITSITRGKIGLKAVIRDRLAGHRVTRIVQHALIDLKRLLCGVGPVNGRGAPELFLRNKKTAVYHPQGTEDALLKELVQAHTRKVLHKGPQGFDHHLPHPLPLIRAGLGGITQGAVL